MKYATRILVLAATMLPILAIAQLKSSEKVVADVPFAFMVGTQHIPAGQCIVQSAGLGRTLMIQNVAAKVALFSPISTTGGGKASADYALVFHKYQDRAFLVGLRIAGDREMYRLPESKAEAELRAQNVQGTEEYLLASLK